MIINEKEPITSSKFIDYGVEERDFSQGKTYGPQYSGLEAFAMSAMSGFAGSYVVTLGDWAKREVNNYLDSQRGEEMLSPEQLKEEYGFESDKALSKNVAVDMFNNIKKKKQYQQALAQYSVEGGGKTAPLLGMGAGMLTDMIPLVLGANLSAIAFRSSKLVKNYMSANQAAVLGGATFDAIEGFASDYAFQKSEIITGEREEMNYLRTATIGTISAGLGSIFALKQWNKVKGEKVDIEDVVEEATNKPGIKSAVSSNVRTEVDWKGLRAIKRIQLDEKLTKDVEKMFKRLTPEAQDVLERGETYKIDEAFQTWKFSDSAWSGDKGVRKVDYVTQQPLSPAFKKGSDTTDERYEDVTFKSKKDELKYFDRIRGLSEEAEHIQAQGVTDVEYDRASELRIQDNVSIEDMTDEQLLKYNKKDLSIEADVKVPKKLKTQKELLEEHIMNSFEPLVNPKSLNWDKHLGARVGYNNFFTGNRVVYLNGNPIEMRVDKNKFIKDYKDANKVVKKPLTTGLWSLENKGQYYFNSTEKGEIADRLDRFAKVIGAEGVDVPDEGSLLNILRRAEDDPDLEGKVRGFYVERGVKADDLSNKFFWGTFMNTHDMTRTFLHEMTHWVNNNFEVITNYPVRETLLTRSNNASLNVFDDEIVTDLSVYMFLKDKGYKGFNENSIMHIKNNLVKRAETIYGEKVVTDIRLRNRENFKLFMSDFTDALMEELSPYVQRNLAIFNGVYKINPAVFTNGKVGKSEFIKILAFSLGLGTLTKSEIEGMEFFMDNRGKND